MSDVVITPLTAADLGDEEAFNSRFGALVSKLNTGFDSDNILAGAVTRAKIGQGAVTQAKMDNTFTWQAPVFQGSWTDWGNGIFGTPGYYKDARGTVHMMGLVKNTAGAGGVIFNLPAGYRPGNQLIFTAMRDTSLSRIDVKANGDVVWQAGAATTVWHSLANITFRAVQ